MASFDSRNTEQDVGQGGVRLRREREWVRMSTRTRRIGRTAGMMTVNRKDLPGRYINIIRTNQALVVNSADLVVGGQEKRERG
jgi:hypothetical protein